MTSLDDAKWISELPTPAQRGLRDWQVQTGRTVRHERWLTGGHTESQVAIVLVSGPDEPTQRVILKTCPSKDGMTEPGWHSRALEASPREFAEAHLLRQPYEPVRLDDDWWLMFQQVAGGGSSDFKSLSSLSATRELPAMTTEVIRACLQDWNLKDSVGMLRFSDYLREVVGRKILPNASLTRWAKFSRHLTEDCSPWITLESGVEANPFAIANGYFDDYLEPKAILLGNAHGDLHGDNVLVHYRPSADRVQFQLIDLSTFRSDAPLARDAANLLITLLALQLPRLDSSMRGALGDMIVGIDSDAHDFLIEPLARLRDCILRGVDQWIRARGLADTWRTQLTWAMVSQSLVMVSHSNVSTSDRWWFFQVAARVGTKALREFGVLPPTAAPRVSIDTSEDQVVARAAANRIADLCSRFDGSISTIAVIADSFMSEEVTRDFAGLGWRFVIDFDALMEHRSFKYARDGGGVHRLITNNQTPTFGSNGTTWYAANGLNSADEPPVVLQAREWRRVHLPSIEHAAEVLAQYSSRPALAVIVGSASEKPRAAVEALLDAFGDRIGLVSLGGAEAQSLDEYQPTNLRADVALTIQALADAVPPSRALTVSPTLPGVHGAVAVSPDQVLWFEEVGELLHSRAGIVEDVTVDSPVGFYRGRRISWFELDLQLDAPRRQTNHLKKRIQADLQERDPRRLMVGHLPGAGGTTMIRRIAWELRQEFPLLLVNRASDPGPVASRIRELARLTGQPVLAVFELVDEAVVDTVFGALRADSVPTLLLIVRRRIYRSDQADRSLYIGVLEGPELEEVARLFKALAPHRARAISKVAAEVRVPVPFLFGLAAFEERFEGISDYVSQSVSGIDTDERAAITFISIAHRFAGAALPTSWVSGMLSLADPARPRLLERIGEAAFSVLVEETPGYWRTLHWAVAHELLVHLLRPQQSSTPEGWKTNLAAWATRLIDSAHHTFGGSLPTDLRLLFDRLFIEREGGGYVSEPAPPDRGGAHATRTVFSELLTSIPSLAGRLEVMKKLSSRFPKEAHYWAHYGRLLSYAAEDFPAAHEAMDLALELDSKSTVLRHMNGMVFRSEARSIMRLARSVNSEEMQWREKRVLDLTARAMDEFEHASRLDDTSEYPWVARAQTACEVIEYGFATQEAESTYSSFLSRNRNEVYAGLLLIAEDALDRMREIRGGDRPSRLAAEVETEMMALYDDFPALILGWRRLLERDDVLRGPVRRRIARAYRRRAGSWRKASHAEVRHGSELLLANLRDDPSDDRSTREWLEVARFLPVSLNEASEYVDYWVSASPSRDALFYDYVLTIALALVGRESARAAVEIKLSRIRERVAQFPNRRFVYEWLGAGEDLNCLVNHKDLSDWERRTASEDPSLLRRVEGRISRIRSATSGSITFGPGLSAFYTPAVSGLVDDRHLNTRVSMLLGFSYEGPQAWSVKPI